MKQTKPKEHHEWVCSYVDAGSGKQYKFTCSSTAKKYHEQLMNPSKNKLVRNVSFTKGVS